MSASNVGPRRPYSPFVRCDDLVFLSGQTPVADDGTVVGYDIEAQTRAALDNLVRTLRAAGCDLSHVIKVNAFLNDLDDAPGYNRVYLEYFSEPLPARSTVGVRLPGFRVEIEAIARRPDRSA